MGRGTVPCDGREKVHADSGREPGGSFLVTGKQCSQLMEEDVGEVWGDREAVNASCRSGRVAPKWTCPQMEVCCGLLISVSGELLCSWEWLQSVPL